MQHNNTKNNISSQNPQKETLMIHSVFCTVYWDARCVPNPIQVILVPYKYIDFFGDEEDGIRAYLREQFGNVPSFSVLGVTPRWKEVHHKDCFGHPIPSLLTEED